MTKPHHSFLRTPYAQKSHVWIPRHLCACCGRVSWKLIADAKYFVSRCLDRAHPRCIAHRLSLYVTYLSYTKYSNLSANRLKRAPPVYEQPWFIGPPAAIQVLCCEFSVKDDPYPLLPTQNPCSDVMLSMLKVTDMPSNIGRDFFPTLLYAVSSWIFYYLIGLFTNINVGPLPSSKVYAIP